MKTHFRTLVGAAAAVSLTTLIVSCDKEEDKVAVPVYPKREITTATPQQRAEKLGVLACIPADVSAVVAVENLDYLNALIDSYQKTDKFDWSVDPTAPNKQIKVKKSDIKSSAVKADDATGTGTVIVRVAGVDQAVESDGVVEEQETDEYEVIVDTPDCPVKEVAIAFGSGVPAELAKIDQSVKTTYANVTKMYIQMLLQSVTGESPDPQQMKAELIQRYAMPLLALLSSVDMSPGQGTAPLMVVARVTDGAEMKDGMKEQFEMIASQSKGIVTYTQKDIDAVPFHVLDINMTLLTQQMTMVLMMAGEELGSDAVQSAQALLLLAKLAQTKLVIGIAEKDDYLIVQLCTNPDKQMGLAKVENSVLSRKDFSFVDANLSEKQALTSYASPAMLAAMKKLYIAYMEGYMEGLQASLPMVVEKAPEMKAQCEQIGQAFAKYGAAYKAAMEMIAVNEPQTGQGWWNKGLHLEFSMGDSASFDLTKDASLGQILSNPDACLLMTMTMSEKARQLSYDMCDAYTQMIVPGFELAKYAVAKSDDKRGTECIEKVTPMVPLIMQMIDGAKAAYAAGGSQCGFIVDLLGDVPKDARCEAKLQGKMIPRVAVFQTLKDRSKLGPAWDKMKDPFKKLMAATECPDLQFLTQDPVKEEKDGITTYSYKAPWSTDNCVPALSLTDKIYVEGTSKVLNKNVIKQALTEPVSIPAGVYGPLGFYAKLDVDKIAKYVQSFSGSTGECPVNDVVMTISKESGKLVYRVHINGK